MTKIMSNKEFLSTMNKKLGEESIYSLEGDSNSEVTPVSTGVPSLDHALGIGGFPLGRLVEIYGDESSGKTTLSLTAVASFQRLALDKKNKDFYGKKAIFIDMEHAIDPLHASNLGVDISEETGIMITQPDTGEKAFDLAVSTINSGQVGILVIDSLANMIPKKVLEGSAEDNHIALGARMNSQNIPKVVKAASANNTLVLIINQTRINVGQMFGNPETTPGGKALRFNASIRLHIRRKDIKLKDIHFGQEIICRIIKNKVSAPFKTTSVDYLYDGGFDLIKNIMDLAISTEVIGQAGAWYYLGESTKNPSKDSAGNSLKWHGKDQLETSLKNSPALFKYINDMVRGLIPKDTQFVEENDIDVDEKEGAASV